MPWTQFNVSPLTDTSQDTYISAACSSDGQIVYVCTRSNKVFKSTDGGTTWTTLINNFTLYSWESVACSGDGNYLLVGSQNSTNTIASNDGGNTSIVLNIQGARVAVSENGIYGYIGTLGDYIYKFYFPDMVIVAPLNTPVGSWLALACSADGSVIATADYTDVPRISRDGGDNWYLPSHTGVSWHGASCSSNGDHILFVPYDSSSRPNYYHYNGSTWDWTISEEGVSGEWASAACSSDGKHVVAAITNLGVYVSNDYGKTGWIAESTGSVVWRSVCISKFIVSSYYISYVAAYQYGVLYSTNTINCLLEGTSIQMVHNCKNIEDLKSGDIIKTKIGSSIIKKIHKYTTNDTADIYVIKKNSFDENIPNKDLYLSKNHGLLFNENEYQKYTNDQYYKTNVDTYIDGLKKITAKHCSNAIKLNNEINDIIKTQNNILVFYNIELEDDRHCIYANNMCVESMRTKY